MTKGSEQARVVHPSTSHRLPYQVSADIRTRHESYRERNRYLPPMRRARRELGLTGASVFIAAASRGLGPGAATQFAAEGANVTIASRSGDDLARARETIPDETDCDESAVFTVEMDLADRNAIESGIAAATNEFGGLDALSTSSPRSVTAAARSPTSSLPPRRSRRRTTLSETCFARAFMNSRRPSPTRREETGSGRTASLLAASSPTGSSRESPRGPSARG